MSLLKRLAQQVGLRDEARAAEAVLSRRKLLFGGLSSLAALSPSVARAAPRPSANRFLVDRLTFGWTEAEQLLADTLGYHGYLEYHLNPAAINDADCDARVAVYNRLNWSSNGLYDSLPQITMNQVIESTIVRAVYSKRQLFERVVEFWTDHFNIEMMKSFNQWLFPVWMRDVIRMHAMGTFPQLLAASAQSATMMFYLDNDTSVVGHPNENYARELMELHSMGVGSGYSQQDVEEVARCLTGWGAHHGFGEASTFEFEYEPNKHDNGPKVVLGTNIPAGGGFNDGLTVLSILGAHPATAAFISRKMCQRFWSYDPPQALVDAVTNTYLATNGDIKAMLRTLFTTLDPDTAGKKLKRPFHFFVSAMRATKTEIAANPTGTGSPLRDQFKAAGHEPFQWGPPDGYPDRVDAWADAVLARWNFAASLTNHNISNALINIPAFLQGATTQQQIADRMDQAIFGGTMPTEEKAVILNTLGASPNNRTIQDALGLALSAPSYQWY